MGVQIRIGKNIMVEVDAEQEDSQSDPPLSGDEATTYRSMQKADPQEPYPPKLGQVIAATHISLVQKCARIFLKKKTIKGELSNSGMYINNVVLPFLLKMNMSIVCASSECPSPLPRAQISITKPAVTLLLPSRLCHGLRELVGHTKCTPGMYMGVHDASSCTFTQYILFHRYSKIMSLSKHVSTASHTLPLLLSLVSDCHVSKYSDEEQH